MAVVILPNSLFITGASGTLPFLSYSSTATDRLLTLMVTYSILLKQVARLFFLKQLLIVDCWLFQLPVAVIIHPDVLMPKNKITMLYINGTKVINLGLK